MMEIKTSENAQRHEGNPAALAHEPEHRGSIWTHPYMIYVILTAVLFLFLVIAGWLAYTHGWVPSRGIGETP